MRRPWIRRNYDETRLWVWVPFEGGSNRRWLLEELGERVRPDWNKEARRWEIARPHLATVTTALANRFGAVDVYLEFSTTERCHRRCQGAAGDDCTCSCRGERHGGGVYWTQWTQAGDEILIGEVGRVERHYLVRRGDMVP